MKKYFLNKHTDKREGGRENIKILVFLCFIAFVIVLAFVQDLWIVLLIPIIILLGVTAFIIIRLFGCSFCFDESKNTIILNIFGNKKQSIPIERIGRVIRSENKDYRKGAVTTQKSPALFSNEIYAAESKDGTPYFYFIADTETFKFFKSHKIPIFNVHEGVTIDISDRY